MSLGLAKHASDDIELQPIIDRYLFSTCLSLWNRQLVGRGHGLFGKGAFPAPLFMTGTQFLLQNVLARLVLRTGLARRSAAAQVLEWKQYVREVLPNGVSTGLDIGLSNFSLSLITLSFYTMCKSTVPVFLLCFAFIWKIEKPSWHLAGVVAIISCGLVLLVYGETAFDLTGFVLVMSASMLSGLRWTITQVLLQGKPGASGHGASGGPVEILLHLTPVMAATLLSISLVVERLWAVFPGSPYFASLSHAGLTTLILAFGGCLGFMMVWVEFTVIQETSALTFMVAGTFKEIVTVMAAVIFLGEDFYLINAGGLAILIMGVAYFNYHKYRKMAVGEIKPNPKLSSLDRHPSDGDLSRPGMLRVQERPDQARGGDNHSPATLTLTTPMHRNMADQFRPSENDNQ
eukprot:jgi/Astpho2/3104/Aster-03393